VSPRAVADVLRALVTVLAEGQYRWYVFGAQAVLAHGAPRLTADVDVTIEGHSADLNNAEILSVLAKGGIVSRAPGFESMLARARLLPLVHEPSAIAVDVVLAANGIEQDFLERAQSISLAGVVVPVLSVEDLIATKVVAGRRKDREDVLGILQRQDGHFDMGRLRTTLHEFDEALEEPRASMRFERIYKAFSRQRNAKR
jgi:predicted nucleotidyltransferase